jgi:hypothetical protein
MNNLRASKFDNSKSVLLYKNMIGIYIAINRFLLSHLYKI